MSTEDKIWEDFIALNSRDEPTFELLPRVGELEDRRNWTVDTSFATADAIAAMEAADADPLPATEDREGYNGDRHYEYWISGAQLASKIQQTAAEHKVEPGIYAELGAASGRVVRHLARRRAFGEIWAFDINWRHIVWMERHLPTNIIPVQTSSIPTLPLEDASVDVFSAWSVFSHIETFELQWLAEIRRVLKPGGIALLSVVTENQIGRMDKTWPMYEPLTTHPRWSPTFADELKEQGKIVLRWRNDRSYASNVVYTKEYIFRMWSRMFEIADYQEQYPDYQDMIVLKKR
ncbi:class I SAM-dependent methyltransferase [Methylobacterium sp. J-068]|uniref:class I SAM-dependent methyltransferase n=1 Tax=Methylobacterium sp. J-068 TaxID=2836649 RepID=UPI001FBA696C|nr:class I SAM-dependent methyltransferase [Methylobacterium sp. J-068]MCJ2035252.1 class I SAM-dependent methyltransferase [Methylobacterium sp. J-068]